MTVTLSFFIALILFSVFVLAVAYFSFVAGLKVGQRYKHTPEILPSVKRLFKGKTKDPPEVLRERIIYENIENFGTSKPQKDVI
jgi:hypothetical protein